MKIKTASLSGANLNTSFREKEMIPRMKKKNIALLLSALLTAGACAAPTPQGGDISESAVTSETVETDAVSTSEAAPEAEQFTQEETPAEAQPAQKYTDENGLLTDAAKERISALLAEYPSVGCGVYPGLFDFDRDGAPELYLVFHSGGQGCMPTVVFTLDGERLGEFEGYCRDGFCRFSYGEDCVYVHNKYEHSMHTSCDLVTRLTVEDGVLTAEDILHRIGSTGDSFPLKSYTYFTNGERAEKNAFYEAYNGWLWDTETVSAREANEVSLCTYGFHSFESLDDEERAETVVSLYNQYISEKNTVTERFGREPLVFAFDDYDSDGMYEAFVQPKRENGYPADSLYFRDGADFTELSAPFGSFTDFTRIGGLFIAQPFGNGVPCSIYGIRDGAFYEHENSRYGMLIRPGEYFPFEGYVNEEFVLYDSTFEPSHTHKPYFFTLLGNEISAKPVTEADFSDREDVSAMLDELKAELSVYPENAGIVGMYLRGGDYLHVNYAVPAETEDEEGNTQSLPHYRTYMVRNGVVLIDAGQGHYTAKLGGDE